MWSNHTLKFNQPGNEWNTSTCCNIDKDLILLPQMSNCFCCVVVLTYTSPNNVLKTPMDLCPCQYLLFVSLLFVSLIVVLISTSLNENDIEDLFICVLGIWTFLWNACSWFVPTFPLDCLGSTHWFAEVTYVSLILVHCQYHLLLFNH